MTKANIATKLSGRFKNFDMFGTEPAFSVAGSSSMNSYCGACMSILLSVVVTLFAFVRFQTMLEYGETQF